jgi:hypothetical protein
MDATLNAVQRLYNAHASAQARLLDKINDTLLSANMGYTVRTVDGADRLAWEARSLIWSAFGWTTSDAPGALGNRGSDWQGRPYPHRPDSSLGQSRA